MVVEMNGLIAMKDVRKVTASVHFILVDGVRLAVESGVVTIKTQTYEGFMLVDDIEPYFKHMKCWNTGDGADCPACPVKIDAGCAVMSIKKLVDEAKAHHYDNAVDPA